MPVFNYPRRVQVDTGGEPLVPILGAVVLVVITAGAYALLTWLADALGVLGEVPVPVFAFVPGTLGFVTLGYLLGRGHSRVLVYRRAERARAERARLIAVPVRPGEPAPPALSHVSNRPVTSAARVGTVPASERAEVRQ